MNLYEKWALEDRVKAAEKAAKAARYYAPCTCPKCRAKSIITLNMEDIGRLDKNKILQICQEYGYDFEHIPSILDFVRALTILYKEL